MNEETNKEPKKLYRSDKDKMIAGVLGGIAEYFAVDSNMVRIAFVVVVLITAIYPGIIAYIIAYFIIPNSPNAHNKEHPKSSLPLLTPEVSVTPPIAPAEPVTPENAPQPTSEEKVEEKSQEATETENV